MKSSLKKSMALLLSLAVFLSSLLSSLHIFTGTAEASGAIPDNEYSVSYRYLKDGTAESSAANVYLSVPSSGKLIVQNGKIKLEHQITQKYYSYFQYIGFRKAGAAKAVIDPATQQVQGLEGYQDYTVRAANDGSGNWITAIDVEDIANKPDVLMHVVIRNDPEFPPGFVYDNWYNVQLEIDTSGLPGNDGSNSCVNTGQPITIQQLQDVITVSKSVYEGTYEGTDYGNYPAGSKQPLYTNIVLAENFITMGNTTPELIKSVHHSLTAALTAYQNAVISQADKSGLRPLVDKAINDLETMHEIGYNECKEGYTYPPAVPGEYMKGSKDTLQLYLDRAQTVLQNVYATASNVTKAYNQLNGLGYSSFINDQFVASSPVKLIVLDSLDPTTTASQNAPEIARTAAFILPKNNNNEAVRANITFNGAAPTEVVQSTPQRSNQNSGAGFLKDGLDYANEANQAILLNKSSDAQKKVYQVLVRGGSVDNNKWEGRSYLRYKLNGVTKEVYVSYNGDQLDALNAAVTAAQRLYDQAAPLNGSEQAYDSAKIALQAAITAARETAANLAATRPQLAAASSALAQAQADFQATAAVPRYYTAVHATSDAFSAVDSYFLKPAYISTVTGATYVSLTVRDSAIIKEFQIKSGGQFVDSTVVSENTAANTRVVTFKVDSLSSLSDAKVHIAIPEQNYDQTHSVRLNFNDVDNSALAQAVTSANTLLRTAVVGTEPGQYPAAAKTALQSAIQAAGAEATRLTGTNEQSAAALQALSQAVLTFKASAVASNPGTGGGGGGLNDGEYSIGFHIYKKGTNEPSVMYDYVDPNSGKLTVENGSKYVSFTLKQNAEILSFKTERSGALVETDKVSEDVTANTRVVRFPVNDLNARLSGWVKIYWVLPPPINVYDHEYDVELGFDQPVLEETQHELNFTVLHATKDEASTMDRYFVKPGEYSEANGKKKVILTLKDSTTVPSFKVEQNGVLTETTVVSRDTTANTRVVQFETDDLAKLLNAQVHVSTTANGKPYEMDHSIRLKLYTTDKAGLNTKIAAAQSKLDAAVEGTGIGQYPAAAKTALQAAIAAAKAVAASVGASQEAVNAAESALHKALLVFTAAVVLEDADYTIALPPAITDGAGTPIGQYVTNEAKLSVSGGKQVVTFKLLAGVSLKKIQMKKADGSLEEVQPKVAAAAKQPDVVRILSAAASSSSVSFEVDRTVSYILTLVGADQAERDFEIAFAELNPTKADPGTNPGTDPGTGVPGGGGVIVPVNIHGISDGTYSIDYKFLKYNESSTSVMQSYVVTPGKLTVSGGNMFFEFILKQSKEIPGFEIDTGSGLSTPQVSESDEKNNTRTFKFSVKNLDEKLHGWVDIKWPEMNYVHNYDVHLAFNRSSLKAIAPGTDPSKPQPEKPLSQVYVPGEYSMAYTIKLRGKNQTSITADYVKQPAKLVVKDGKSYLQITVQDKQVTGVKIDVKGVLTDAEVVAIDEKRNRRTVQFEVTDTQTNVFAQFIMAVPGKYNGAYDVEFALDGTSVKPYKEQAEEIAPEDQQPDQAAGSFADTQQHWAKAQVERAVALGIVNGYEDGTFRPDGVITRAEFAAMIGRALKLEASQEELSYSDTDSLPDWVKPQLGAIAKAGFMQGYEDGTFRADRNISRAELAVIVARALKLEVDAGAQPSFEDAGSIPAWAQAEVAAAHKHGILNGRDHNLFAPEENATRAEAITLILAVYDALK